MLKDYDLQKLVSLSNCIEEIDALSLNYLLCKICHGGGQRKGLERDIHHSFIDHTVPFYS